MIKEFCKKDDFVKYKIIGNYALICINEEIIDGGVYFDKIRLSISSKDYLISSLIKANYPADRMDAIRNNYELVKDGTAGDKAEEYTQEYLAMQDWRVYSKELATEIMNAKENVT